MDNRFDLSCLLGARKPKKPSNFEILCAALPVFNKENFRQKELIPNVSGSNSLGTTLR